MRITTVAAGRPDVELRLSAEEADDLKAFLGELNLPTIEQVLEDSALADLPSSRKLHELINGIYNELEDLNY